MKKLDNGQHRQAIKIYLGVLAFAALGAGLSDSVWSNYFKDAYNVSALQRGLIEFPRELPGVFCIFLVSFLSSFGGPRIAMLAQGLAIAGLVALGFLTPPYAVMLGILFFYSVGAHLWYPLQDSIGMSLIRDDSNAGRIVGRFKGVSTAFSMLGAIVVFLGFRFNVFSFTTPVKLIFLIAAIFFLVVLILLSNLDRIIGPARRKRGEQSAEPCQTGKKSRMPRFIFRREYKYYYMLAVVFGVQKQIMMVYGPWVLIDLLGKKADTLALLGMAGAFVGIFFIPALGRWIDRFGLKKMLYADAFSFIGVYLAYALLSGGFSSGFLPMSGLPVFLTFALFVIDRMSMQMGIIRSLYLRSIALTPDEIAPTLTTGQSMDHLVSIICASLGGLIWSTWGPQYIFLLAAALSLLNYIVARKAVIPDLKAARAVAPIAKIND